METWSSKKICRFERAGSSPACGTNWFVSFPILKLMKKKTQSAIFLQEMLREPCVAGSNPAPLTNEWVAQLVEQRLKKSVLYLCRVLAVVASVAHNHEVGSSNLSSAPNL